MIDYEKEVNEYGRKLEPVAKQVARDAFSQLLSQGYDYEWLYFAIMNLGQRDITRHRGLFFYKPFQQEVNGMVAANRVEQEEKRQRSMRICAAIAEQIEQARAQRTVTVRLSKAKRETQSMEDIFSEIMNMEETE